VFFRDALEWTRPDSSRNGCSGCRIPEGNHGEDVKELYYYLDALPTHAYCKALYKYPQRAFPYALIAELKTPPAARNEPEFELLDTGHLRRGRIFRHRRRVRKGGSGRCADPHQCDQSRSRRGRTSSPANALVQEYLGLGRDRAGIPAHTEEYRARLGACWRSTRHWDAMGSLPTP
jgi:hypothetical protein